MTNVETSFNRSTSSTDRSLRHTDSSFEIITDDYSMIHNSLSPSTSIWSRVLAPLQDVVVQNKELEKMLEECTNKMAAAFKDHEKMLQQLQTEKDRCAALEEETVRLQVEITSLHQKLDEVQKEKNDVEEKLTESTKLTAPPDDLQRIKINAMRQSKMESYLKKIAEKNKELEEYKKHLKSKDDALVAAYKKNENMRSQLTQLKETLSQEKVQKSGSDSKCNSMQRSLAQANAKLFQEATTFTKEIEHLHGKHADELSTIRAESDQKVVNLQKQIHILSGEVRTKEREKQELCSGLQDAHRKEVEDFSKANKRLSSEVAELKVKLQEKETVLAQLDRERKSLNDDIILLKQQVYTYDSDFVVERQSREQLIVENENLKRQLKDREEQFQRFNDNFTTSKFAQDKLSTDYDELQKHADQLKNECEQLKRERQQKDQRLSQLSDQIATELQLKEQVLIENRNLKDELKLKNSEIHRLNADLGSERHHHKTENDRLRDRIQTLEQTVSVKQTELLQLGGHRTNAPFSGTSTPLTGHGTNANLYTPPPMQPLPGQYKEQPSALPADVRPEPLYPPSSQRDFICPLCARNNFVTYKQLEEHAAQCST